MTKAAFLDLYSKLSNPEPEVEAVNISGDATIEIGSGPYETITDAYNAATSGQTVTPTVTNDTF
jgi:hypothetical protein